MSMPMPRDSLVIHDLYLGLSISNVEYVTYALTRRDPDKLGTNGEDTDASPTWIALSVRSGIAVFQSDTIRCTFGGPA